MFEYELSPLGATFTMLINAYDVPDRFTLTVDGNIVSSSSMTLSNADSVGVIATPIGTDLGVVPNRLTEYVTDIGTVPPNIGAYQQILWFKYTALDYDSFIDKKIVLTIVGEGATLWNISRFCSDLEDGNCQLNGETVTTSCCDGLVNDGGVCAVECSNPTHIVINGVCSPCIANGNLNQGSRTYCCSEISSNGVCVECVPEGGNNDNNIQSACCEGLVLINGVCSTPVPCTPNGSPIGAGGCCSNCAEGGICIECDTITCPERLGVPTETTTCDGTQRCVNNYVGTGNAFTGAAGTINFDGCEFAYVDTVCTPLGDGETC
jgi:hypothetical protein